VDQTDPNLLVNEKERGDERVEDSEFEDLNHYRILIYNLSNFLKNKHSKSMP
jgi:hypothetical protein